MDPKNGPKTDEQPLPCHNSCKYHGFLGLVEWCRHPKHLDPIRPGRMFAIMANGSRCKNYLDWETKTMPGNEPPWPMPVRLSEEFIRHAN